MSKHTKGPELIKYIEEYRKLQFSSRYVRINQELNYALNRASGMSIVDAFNAALKGKE